MASQNIAVELPQLNIQIIKVTVIGDTPLIVHRWSEKARKEMLDKQMKRAKQAKEAKDPHEDFRQSLYIIGKNYDGTERYGFPAIGFKAAAVTACTSIGGVTKVAARQAFHIDAEFVEIFGGDLPRPDDVDEWPQMREDMVRIGMGTADIRYRGQFMPWWSSFEIKVNANMMSAEQILNMMNTAGFAVGVGEWRPEKDGQYGRFHIASAAEIAQVTKMKKAS